MTPIEVAQTFYDAFARRDGLAMGQLYADSATFSDPVFGDLSAEETRRMWHMLTTNGKDLSISYEARETKPDTVEVRWIANYTFSATGRKVTNHVTATLTVREGKILSHLDVFDLNSWLAQALGGLGKFLPFVMKRVIRSKAKKQLEHFALRRNG